MSDQEQIVEQVARLIDPGAWVVRYLGPNGADYQAGDQAAAREIAQNIVQGLGLHEEHAQPYTYQHGSNAGKTIISTRLVTDWKEDAQ